MIWFGAAVRYETQLSSCSHPPPELFYPAFGLLLRPEIAALSMAGSSLIVAVNALMLKNTRLPGIRTSQPGAPSETVQPATPAPAPR